MERQKIDVLDHGYVTLIDVMGNDSAICEAARVSYLSNALNSGSKSIVTGLYDTKEELEKDRKLIRYLMAHKHTSPFEMVEFKFHCKMPIFVARQWIRHRTANVNEISGRYSELTAECYEPSLERIQAQSKSNKQGSEGMLPPGVADNFQRYTVHNSCLRAQDYRHFLEQDISRELARINLPLNTYTEWYWKIDLHNLFHFLKLRMDSHAQYEIRVYANAMADLIKPIVPMAYEAFEDYVLNAVTFSAQEVATLKEGLDNYWKEEGLNKFGPPQNVNLSKRELADFKRKLDL